MANGRLYIVFLASALVLNSCSDWRKSVDGSRSQKPPRQIDFHKPKVFEKEYDDHRVEFEALASYELTAHVAAVDRGPIDDWDFVAPVDISFVWGTLTQPGYIQHTKFHLAKRYVSLRYSPPPGGARYPRDAVSSFANNHIISPSPELKAVIDEIEPGDLVSLKGELVTLRIYDLNNRLVHTMKTSTTRADKGNGACENIWLEEIYIHPKRDAKAE